VSRSHGGIDCIDIVELDVIYLSSETKRRQGKMTIRLSIPSPVCQMHARSSEGLEQLVSILTCIIMQAVVMMRQEPKMTVTGKRLPPEVDGQLTVCQFGCRIRCVLSSLGL
jgi:hypothetical protein